MSVDEQLPTDSPTREPPAVPSLQSQDRDGLDQESQEAAKKEPTAESYLMSGKSNDTQSQSKGFGKSIIALWWQEIVAAILLCAAVIASYATLAPYQGKSLPEWPRYITFSALLSTYSVVLRLAATFLLAEGLAQLKWRWFNRGGGVPLRDLVLHDSATRGPIGSLQLLWRLPLPITWQWVGCVLIVVALATGPLTQLVLQYEQCSVLTDNAERQASIPRASVFFGQGSHSGAATNTLSLAEQSSINAGIYSLSYVGAECSSGNCTFTPYTSIGYCGECDDISADMQFAESDSVYGQVSSFIPGGLSTNYSGGYGIKQYAAAGNVLNDGTNYFMIVIGPPNRNEDGAFADCNNNRTWACQGYAAATCSLYPCIRNYTASMTNGTFQETVVNTWSPVFGGGQWSDGSYVYSAINKSCLTDEQSSGLRAMNYTLNDDGPWLAYNGSGQNSGFNQTNEPIDLAKMEQDLLNRQCLYGVDTFFDNGLLQYLSSDTFSGNVTGDLSSSTQVAAWAGPQLLLTIYNYGYISFERTQAVFQNISLSLTNHMRMNPNGPSHSGGATSDPQLNDYYSLLKSKASAPGLAYTTKTCLQVRWGWLAFPTVLAALTLVFFAGVLFSSGGLTQDVRTWKSSPLPLLFFGNSLSETHAASQHVSDLNRVAKRTNVSLAKDEDGNMVLRKQGAIADHDSEI